MRLAVVASHPVQYQAPLFRELARRCELHVLFGHKATAVDQAAAGFNVDFDWDVDLTSGFENSFLRNIAARPGLRNFAGCDTPEVGVALRDLAPDAVLLMGWHLKCYWQAIWAARCADIPVMVRGDSHLETPRSALKRAGKEVVYPIALRVFDAALYVGEQSRRYWEHYRFPRTRMFFSPHCVDNDWFAARATPEVRSGFREGLGVDDNTLLMLFAGKLEAIKRVGDVIDATATCRGRGRNMEVLVAGSGALEEFVKKRAHEKGVPLHLLGFCNQSRMPAVYAAADALVLASESETWGLVANEAIACGRPVILSKACGAAADLAADRTAGRIFACGDVDALARAIDNLIDDPPTRRALATKADCYSIGASVDGIFAALNWVQQRNRSK